MLVVDSIVPGSFAEDLLEPGDILTKVDGRVVTHFLALEDVLDSLVGQSVSLDLDRGGKALQVHVQVMSKAVRTLNPSCTNLASAALNVNNEVSLAVSAFMSTRHMLRLDQRYVLYPAVVQSVLKMQFQCFVS